MKNKNQINTDNNKINTAYDSFKHLKSASMLITSPLF